MQSNIQSSYSLSFIFLNVTNTRTTPCNFALVLAWLSPLTIKKFDEYSETHMCQTLHMLYRCQTILDMFFL